MTLHPLAPRIRPTPGLHLRCPAAWRALLAGLLVALPGCGDDPTTTVTGTLLSDACTPIASWNLDADITTGAFGSVAVAAGGTRPGLVVTLVNRAGDTVSPGGGRQVQLVVADEAVARVTADAGAPATFDVAGLRPGTTTCEVRLVERGRSVYRSGAIPLRVYGEPENPRPSFLMRKNGIWCVLVADGALATAECGRTADPGRLEGRVDEVGEHYFFRRFDPGCVQVPLEGPRYRYTYEFADDCVARFVIGDHPPDLLTFHLVGITPGDTSVRFHFFRNDTLEFSSPDIPVHIEPALPPGGASALATGFPVLPPGHYPAGHTDRPAGSAVDKPPTSETP